MKNPMLDPIYQTMIGFENMLNRAHSTSTYPPYNLYKCDDHNYVIEIAVSGWKKSELDVSLAGTTLTVTGTKEQTEDTKNYLVRGLAHRSWTRTWTLEPDISVEDVELCDGVLYIELYANPKSKTRHLDIK
jgi:molecular chaperone IbpA